MGLKRDHTSLEIEALAARFHESWSEGQIIRSWLRNHGAELRKLIREEDWSWTNVGKALSLAGIQFKTNKRWTGENVRRAVDLAMKPKKVRGDRSSAPPPATSAPSFVPAASPPSRPAGEPEFKIIQRRPGSTATNNRGGGE